MARTREKELRDVDVLMALSIRERHLRVEVFEAPGRLQPPLGPRSSDRDQAVRDLDGFDRNWWGSATLVRFFAPPPDQSSNAPGTVFIPLEQHHGPIQLIRAIDTPFELICRTS
jgi:hypothetical protein